MAQHWRAVSRIRFGMILAYMPGDIVPDSAVARYNWDDLGLVQRFTEPDSPDEGLPERATRTLTSTTVAKVEYITNAEYEALGAEEPHTLYITY
jgi:hypothetical protein